MTLSGCLFFGYVNSILQGSDQLRIKEVIWQEKVNDKFRY